jgi:thiol-disulfide isomerase/thioredoxin
MIIRKDPQGAMVVSLAWLAKLEGGDPDVQYRPVAFDDEKARHSFELREGGWSGSAAFTGTLLSLNEFRLDPDELPFDRVRRIGIEVVPDEARREAEAGASKQAFQEAGAAGIELLPRPEVGKPFDFALTAAGGRTIRSADLKGKVVLILCWASWSGPCTEELPRLRTLQEKNHGRGLEIIGLNFDQNRAVAERLVKSLALPFPQVFVPPDDRTRRLWKEGPGLPSYPRLLLLDRDGVLRHDGGPEELKTQLDRLLATDAR